MRERLVDWHDFVHTLHDSIPDVIHPMARGFCHEYCVDMHIAIDAGNMAEFHRLRGLFNARIISELRWEAQKFESISTTDPACVASAVTLRQLADRREAGHV
jgi:hypothetical protein